MAQLDLAVQAERVDIGAFLDRQPVGRAQIGVLLACAGALFVDGFDTQAIGYVAPALVRDLGLSRGSLGPIFSAGLLGLMLGALCFGPLADRIGRKPVILGSMAAFGLLTFATIFANDATSLLLLRFFTGIGLGGAMPNAVALTSEYSPRRRRATMVMTMFCGFSVGAAAGGFIAAGLIPLFGWKSVFLIGGLVPLLAIPVLAAVLPESARFLLLAGRPVAGLLARVFPRAGVDPSTCFTADEARHRGFPVTALFQGGRALSTLLLWVVFFASLLDLYFLASWLPTVLTGLGVTVSVAAAIGAMLQVGGIVGTFALGRVIDRFSFGALAVTYAVAAVAVAAIGRTGHSVPLVTLAVFMAGFCIVGGQIAANALAAALYPTAVRATGVGWSLGIGRIGSVVGPLVAGQLIGLHWGPEDLFLAAAVPALCGAAAALLLSRTALLEMAQ